MTDLVVWRRPPPLISKGLYRRTTKLTLKETLWVYDDLLGVAVSMALIVLSILWLALPYTMQGWGIVMFACSLVSLASCISMSFDRLLSGAHDPLKFNYTHSKRLSYRGRKELCLLDRNRKRAPGWERSWRMPNIEHNQYSVWVTSETRGTTWNDVENEAEPCVGLMFRIIEHRPQRYGIGPRWAMICEARRYVKVSHENNEVEPQIIALNAERFVRGLDFDQATDLQRDLEEVADYLEGHSYNKKVKVHETERIALQLRR